MPHATETPSSSLTYTSYEGNSWSAHFRASNINILVDPWLVDTLTFGGLDFIYSGSKRIVTPESTDINTIASHTNIILLTMSIDDHAHKPTLQALPKNILVVGSPSAAAVARQLGYTTVYALDHGEELRVFDGKMTITATMGALVGPPWSKREVGFVIREHCPQGISLYYEPHADFVAESVKSAAPVDVVVTPPCTQSLLGYELVKGATTNVELLKLLRPRVVIPLMNADFDASGPLNDLLSERGGPVELERQIKAMATDELAVEQNTIRVCMPPAPGEPMVVVV